jgi:subtilisin family serine protease
MDAVVAGRLPALADVREVAPRWKLHPALQTNEFMPWTEVGRTPDGRTTVALYVLLHADQALERADEILTALGGRVFDRMESVNGVVAFLPSDRVNELAANDAVSWIEPSLPKMSGVAVNDSNRALTQVNTVQAAPYSLDGSGVKVLVYDGGTALATHLDFGGRLTARDFSGTIDHATHVSATIGGSGAASGGTFRGMAPGVTIESYGFEYDGLGQFLFTNPGDFEDDYAEAITVRRLRHREQLDRLQRRAQRLHLPDAGRLRRDEQPDRRRRARVAGRADPRLLGQRQRARRLALRRRGLRRLLQHRATRHGQEPHHGGRAELERRHGRVVLELGPDRRRAHEARRQRAGLPVRRRGRRDLGVSFSNTAYGVFCGTSMASPTVCGISSLLLQDYRAHFGAPDPTNATLKVLLAHTAFDLGNAGPDYQTGYGSVRAQGRDRLHAPGPGRERRDRRAGLRAALDRVRRPGRPELRITMAWDDVPAAPQRAGLARQRPRPRRARSIGNAAPRVDAEPDQPGSARCADAAQPARQHRAGARHLARVGDVGGGGARLRGERRAAGLLDRVLAPAHESALRGHLLPERAPDRADAGRRDHGERARHGAERHARGRLAHRCTCATRAAHS